MRKINGKAKTEFLELGTPEDYMVFLKKYGYTYLELIQDAEMERKMCELIRMAPGSCGDGTGNHDELWKKE